MTVKLRKLKGQPLLSPPGSKTAFRRLIGEDRECISAYLEKECGSGSENAYAWMSYYMQELAMPVDTIHAEESVNEALGTYRSISDGLNIARMLFLRKQFGLDCEATEFDEACMRDGVKQLRRRDDGDHLWGLLHCMSELGLPQRLSGRDEKRMDNALKGFRLSGDGEGVAKMLYYSAKLGRPAESTERDEALMEEAMTDCRETRHGWGIAEMLHYLKEIPPPKTASAARMEEIPPMKKFA